VNHFFKPIIIAILISALYGCTPKVIVNFNKDGLNNTVTDSISFYTNAAYKIHPEYSNDFIVSLIRMNLLNVPQTEENMNLLIELIAIKNRAYINEVEIKSKLTKNEVSSFGRAFPNGLNINKTVAEIVQNDERLNGKFACPPEIVDAHWAWFSGTGDTNIISKLIESSKVLNTPCCFDCIEWSVPNQATQNEDVYNFLISRQNQLSEKQREWFSRFIPSKSACRWKN
jgi:hypothetical protein